MKRLLLSLFIALPLMTFAKGGWPNGYVKVEGENLRQANGELLHIKGTNLGNWLNPEGYMFNFKRVNSARMINETISQLVGPDDAAAFWREYKDGYITREDIRFIASTGANTIRLPFHYKLFTSEDYMGNPNPLGQTPDGKGYKKGCEGFARMDQVIEWCREFHLYLILDMHDCPGGQTGDNIDDSFGYPWLFESEVAQQQFCDIWQMIARRYKNEKVILGYELMNEPIAHYFEHDLARLKSALEPLQKRAVAAIRKVDQKHIVLLGGAVWNSHFDCFSDWKYDHNIMYSCHRYGGEPTADAIRSFIDFRDKTGLPMYMGELGHNTDEWQSRFVHTMDSVNIGWTFWPYKKMGNSCWMGINKPAEWDSIVNFAEAQRLSYSDLRSLYGKEPHQLQDAARRALREYLDHLSPSDCVEQTNYLRSIGLVPKK